MYVAKAMVIMLFSCVKMLCLRAKAHMVFHLCLYNKPKIIYMYMYVYPNRTT